MTDQPNTETDAERAAPEALTFTYTNYRGEVAERRVRPVSFRFGSTDWHPEPQWLLRAYDFEKNAEREFAVRDIVFLRVIAPAPAEDVEQRVSDEVVARWCRDEEGPDHKYHTEAMKLARDLRDARAALAAMPSGRQRGLLEAATSDEALDAAAAKFAELNDAGLYRDQWKAVISAAIRTAAAQLGEPDDGWLSIASAPKDGTPLLACDAAAYPNRTWVVWWVRNYGGSWASSHSEGLVVGLTHWRQLPPAPSVPR